VRDGRSCPNCGLSVGAIIELTAVRERHANHEFLTRYESAVKRMSRLEAENTDLRNSLRKILDAVQAAEVTSPLLKKNGMVDRW
jgi:hypothetical protein